MTESQLAGLVSDPPPQQWFSVKLNDDKIGFASLALQTTSRAVSVASTLSVARAENASLELSEVRRYQRKAPFALTSIVSVERASDGVREIRVERTKTGMERRILVDCRLVSLETFAASGETLADPVSQSFARPAWLESGEQATLVELDSDTGSDARTQARVARKTATRIAGVDSNSVEIELEKAGQVVTRSMIGDRGVVIRATVGAFSFVAQDERTAKSAIVGLDLAVGTVSIDRDLGKPSSIRELVLAVRFRDATALQRSSIPSADNQRVRREDDHVMVTIGPGPGSRVTRLEGLAHLLPTVSIDSAEASVSRLAAELAPASLSRRQAVQAISRWVFESLEKRLATDLNTASSVLAKRVGDCTEHVLLFLALARAAGIPAREVSGLIYLGDERRSFGWHAWAEVEVDGRWWRVDPSWGEFPASASHITLGIGDDSRWIALIGGLELEILAVK